MAIWPRPRKLETGDRVVWLAPDVNLVVRRNEAQQHDFAWCADMPDHERFV